MAIAPGVITLPLPDPRSPYRTHMDMIAVTFGIVTGSVIFCGVCYLTFDIWFRAKEKHIDRLVNKANSRSK